MFLSDQEDLVSGVVVDTSLSIYLLLPLNMDESLYLSSPNLVSVLLFCKTESLYVMSGLVILQNGIIIGFVRSCIETKVIWALYFDR